MPPHHLMSEDLIYQMLYASLSLADSTIQIWFTVTFAIIVAGYFAGTRIGHPMYRLVSSLYGIYSLELIT